MQILSLIYNMDSSQSPLDDPSPDTSPHVPATPPPFFAHQAGDYEQSTGFYSAGPPAFLVHDHDEDEDEDTSGENVGFASLENSNLDYTTRDYLPPTRDYHSNRGYSPAPPSREYTPSFLSIWNESQISSATWFVAVAVKHNTRSTPNSSAKRAIFKYSGLKEAPH
jgi:hypothetical protein